MIKHIQILISRELTSFMDELRLFPDDQTVWKVLPGITNSAGNLTLHICGNLNHFIGAVLGNTGYLRDRDSEFSKRSGDREELIQLINDTKYMINSVLPGLSDEVLAKHFPEPFDGKELPCDLFLMHLTTHLAHHLGQIGYLRRILTKNNQISGAVSLRAIINN